MQLLDDDDALYEAYSKMRIAKRNLYHARAEKCEVRYLVIIKRVLGHYYYFGYGGPRVSEFFDADKARFDNRLKF